MRFAKCFLSFSLFPFFFFNISFSKNYSVQCVSSESSVAAVAQMQGGDTLSISVPLHLSENYHVSFGDNVRCEVIENQQYVDSYQGRPCWENPDLIGINPMTDIRVRDPVPLYSSSRSSGGDTFSKALSCLTLGYFGYKIAAKAAHYLFGEKEPCEICKLKRKSNYELRQLYRQFKEKSSFGSSYFCQEYAESAWRSLDFDRKSRKAQEFLLEKFNEFYRQDEAEKRRQQDLQEQQRREAAERKKQQEREKIQKISQEQIVQVSENEIFHFTQETLRGFYDEPDSPATSKDVPWHQRTQRRAAAIKRILDGEQEVWTERIMVSQDLQTFLAHNGGNARQYALCEGNALQHVIHKEFVEVVLDTVGLSSQEASQEIEQFQKLMISFSDDGVGLNKKGEVIHAMRISDFCKSMLDYEHGVIRGRIEKQNGVVQAVHLDYVQEHAEENFGLMLRDILPAAKSEDLYASNDFLGIDSIAEQLRLPQENSFLSRKAMDMLSRYIERAISESSADNEFYFVSNSAHNFCDLQDCQQHERKQFAQESLRSRLQEESCTCCEKQSQICERICEASPRLLCECDKIHEAFVGADSLEAWHHPEIWDERIEKRKNALSAEKVNQEKIYEFSEELQQFVEKNSSDATLYKYCYGCEIQHVLHEEFVENLDRIAFIKTENLEKCEQELISALQSLSVSYADCGIMHNKAGDIENAWRLSNIVSIICDYAEAVALGVWDGVKDVYHMFRHPADTICDIARVLWFVYSQSASYWYNKKAIQFHFLFEGILYEDQGRYLKAVQNIQEKKDAVAAIMETVWQATQESSGPERVRFISRIATGIVLQNKCFGLFKRAGSSLAKHARQFAKYVKDLKKTEVFRPIASGIGVLEEFERDIQCMKNTVCHFVQKGRNAARRVGDFGGRVLEKTKRLLKIEYIAVSAEDAMKFQKLLTKYFRVPKVLKQHGIKKIKVGLDKVKHIIGGEVRHLEDVTTGIIKEKLMGFHFGDLERLSKDGVVRVRNVLEHEVTKVIKADVFWKGSWYNEKTFFPKKWSLEKVAKKMGESIKNKNILKFEKQGLDLMIEGITQEKVSIRIVFDQYGELRTSYPLWQELI